MSKYVLGPLYMELQYIICTESGFMIVAKKKSFGVN